MKFLGYISLFFVLLGIFFCNQQPHHDFHDHAATHDWAEADPPLHCHVDGYTIIFYIPELCMTEHSKAEIIEQDAGEPKIDY